MGIDAAFSSPTLDVAATIRTVAAAASPGSSVWGRGGSDGRQRSLDSTGSPR